MTKEEASVKDAIASSMSKALAALIRATNDLEKEQKSLAGGKRKARRIQLVARKAEASFRKIAESLAVVTEQS